MDHRKQRVRRADAPQQRLHTRQAQVHARWSATWHCARAVEGSEGADSPCDGDTTMSGWTTIWMLLVSVCIGTVVWKTTPKGPNQVYVGEPRGTDAD